MALTKATLFCRNALKREVRLKEERNISTVPYGKIVTQENVQKTLKGYASSGSLKKSDISECIHLLEMAESKGPCKNIALYIANEIIPQSICEGVNLDNISTSNRLIIESSIEKTKIYDRLLHNQELLEKRFDIASLCKGRSLQETCHIICESIDTYNIPLTHKFNIALENTILSLVKNNIPFASDMEIANYVVEYFVNRDPIIYDATYTGYQRLLEESELYDINESTGFVAALLSNNGNFYGNKVNTIFKEANDKNLYKFGDMFNAVVTESDVINYISILYEYIDHNQVTTLDKNRIYYSVDMLANHTGISHSYIHTITSNIFGDIDIKPSIDVDFADKSQDVFATIPSIDNIMIEIQTSQCKDADLLNDMYMKILSKPTSSIFGKTYEIIQCVRKTLCLVALNNDSKLSDACDATIKFINNLYYMCNNFTMVEELNRNIKTFLLNLPDEIKDYPDIVDFQSKISKIIDLNYDTSISEDTNIYACFDNDIEIMEAFTKLAIASEEVMRKSIDRDALDYIVAVCTENGWVKPLYEAYSYLNGPKYLFESAYNKIYDSKTMVSVSDIMNKVDSSSHKENTLESLFLTIEATKLFEDLNESFTIVEEAKNNPKLDAKTIKKKGTNFITSLKLGLQVLKKKAQKFDTKQKEMWRTIDAYGNKFTRLLEEDDDKRRAQLIKGQCIPSFSKCIQTGVGLIVTGVATGNILIPIITAFGMMGTNKFLDARQRKQMIEEIEIELKIVEKQIDMAEKDDDLRAYRQLLMVQRKLQHEAQRLRFKRRPFNIGGRK